MKADDAKLAGQLLEARHLLDKALAKPRDVTFDIGGEHEVWLPPSVMGDVLSDAIARIDARLAQIGIEIEQDAPRVSESEALA